MFESFVLINALESGKINNPHERLHGYLIKVLSKFANVDVLHGEFRKIEFSLSPIYSLENFDIVTRFEKGSKYFFRITSLNDQLFSKLSRYFSLSPKFELANIKFEITEYISEVKYEILEKYSSTLYFISPTTFRISKKANYPLPDPAKILKSLSSRAKIEYPEDALIEKFSIQSKVLSFSHHKLIGFIGYIVFSYPIKNLHLAHFTGIGYSISRGCGSVISPSVKASDERINQYHWRLIKNVQSASKKASKSS
ncbi:MAG: CRISPR-associated endoribonuclease Cas6 [Thermotogaceae bacterium]|jgi:CRISPR-associated endoribonuclease Cas6|nr:CRISPR-associated endoribonuclease Cas6 [Thermotogaceae bacterium]